MSHAPPPGGHAPRTDDASPLRRWQVRFEAALARELADGDTTPQRLGAAMRHAALGGGKRMRPLLVYASGGLVDAAPDLLDAPALAVELVHAYSLVHDDLPAMDDDALRRGQPTVHIAFDEATAILAGDALQSLAFEVLARAPASDALRVQWLGTLATAAGRRGMCGGQALDMDATGSGRADQDTGALAGLEHMHALKTGALIRAAVRMGALAGTADAATLQRLDTFAAALGLAFQVRDDLLDREASSAQLGKTAGKDLAQAKATYPALLGVAGAHAKLEELAAIMQQALAPFGERAGTLTALGMRAAQRDR